MTKGGHTMKRVEKLSVTTPATWISGPKQGCWIYEDYAAIAENGRYEVVDGVLYMLPTPNINHQKIVGEIFAYLQSFTHITRSGKVSLAPLDVELSYGNVVQPDILVILNKHLDRITYSRVIGAPDLVVEVASPNTARHDLCEKEDAYARAGVPEYWIVNPDACTVELLLLEGKFYRTLGLYSGDALLPSVVLSNFPVQVGRFFVAL